MKPGYKVVCVDDSPGELSKHSYPSGYVIKGQVYVVSKFVPNAVYHGANRPGVFILGLAAINIKTGENRPWRADRFRLLDEIKSELSALMGKPETVTLNLDKNYE